MTSNPTRQPILTKATPYLSWALLSSTLLTGARAIDPYVFGFAAFGAAGISGGLFLAALLFGRRQIPWALVATVPTVISFAVLSTYKWA